MNMPPKKASVAAEPEETFTQVPPPPPPAVATAIPSSCSGSVRLPEFFKDDPATWFGSIESTFYVRGITDPVAKVHFTVQRLDAETTTCIRTLLRDWSTPASFDQLRTKLCAFFERSPESRLDQILSTTTFGDVKPSRFAEELARLGDSLTMDDVLNRVFLRSLPRQVANTVANSGSKSFADVAIAADQVYASVDEASRLHDRISSPSLVTAVAVRGPQNRNPGKPQPQRFQPGDQKLCWFHRRRGNSARSCWGLLEKNTNVKRFV